MARRSKRPAGLANHVGPTRSCVGCGLRTAPTELVRCILGPDGDLVVDLAGRAFGRGAWVHARPQCFRSAFSKGFARSFKQAIAVDYAGLLAALRMAAERRVMGLLRAAQSSRKLVFGSQAVFEMRESAKLMLLACDSRASAKEPFVAAAIGEGRLLLWSSKAWYGQVLGRGDVAVVALLDAGLAQAVAQAVSFWRLGADDSASTTPPRSEKPTTSLSQATDAAFVVAQPASGALESVDESTVVDASPGEQPAEKIPEVR